MADDCTAFLVRQHTATGESVPDPNPAASLTACPNQPQPRRSGNKRYVALGALRLGSARSGPHRPPDPRPVRVQTPPLPRRFASRPPPLPPAGSVRTAPIPPIGVTVKRRGVPVVTLWRVARAGAPSTRPVVMRPARCHAQPSVLNASSPKASSLVAGDTVARRSSWCAFNAARISPIRKPLCFANRSVRLR